VDEKQLAGVRAQIVETAERLREALGDESRSGGLWWVLWDWYGYYYLGQSGAELRGLSFRQKLDEWLLCVRATVDGAPVVAFMSGSTTTSCIRKFCAACEQHEVKWYEDRYA